LSAGGGAPPGCCIGFLLALDGLVRFFAGLRILSAFLRYRFCDFGHEMAPCSSRVEYRSGLPWLSDATFGEREASGAGRHVLGFVILSRRVRRTQQRAVDFAVRLKPSASGKPGLPHAGHSDHPVIFSILCRQHLLASPVALRGGAVSRGMDFSVYRPRLRGQAS